MPDLPEGYDMANEPEARHRLRREPGDYKFMSGSSYVVMLLKGESVGSRVPIRRPQRCDHMQAICTGKIRGSDIYCADSWQYDHSILWSRSAGGRSLISQLGLDHDKHHNPSHPAN